VYDACDVILLPGAISDPYDRDMLTYSFTPSERCASSIDEFLAVCRAEPTLAADHLQQGYFEPWLRDTGHPDLASAAAQARGAAPSTGAALDAFLSVAIASPQPRARDVRKTTTAPKARRPRGTR
jgi:hypothetical protein